VGDREGGALPTAHPTDTSTGTAGSTASPGTGSQNSRCFASVGTVVLRDRPRIRVRLEYSREPTSVGACALCRGSQQVSAQQDRSAGPVSGLRATGSGQPCSQTQSTVAARSCPRRPVVTSLLIFQ